ncbi:hypothetical protein [Elizabethkingia anophelis]|uniref:hypothetical protein n=1 Tax=Elizabethkingia anophelis TaxID=1117645 RepID=UPI0021A38475
MSVENSSVIDVIRTDKDNVVVLTISDHLERHNGNFRNKTTGELKNRRIIN